MVQSSSGRSRHRLLTLSHTCTDALVSRPCYLSFCLDFSLILFDLSTSLLPPARMALDPWLVVSSVAHVRQSYCHEGESPFIILDTSWVCIQAKHNAVGGEVHGTPSGLHSCSSWCNLQAVGQGIGFSLFLTPAPMPWFLGLVIYLFP